MKEISVYLASGWFTPSQLEEVKMIEQICEGFEEINLYSPRKENLCSPTATQREQCHAFNENIKHVHESDLIIANTNNKDMGTIFEAGVAYWANTPIIYFASGLKGPFNLMLAQSGIAVSTDISQLIHHLNEFIKDQQYVCGYDGGEIE